MRCLSFQFRLWKKKFWRRSPSSSHSHNDYGNHIELRVTELSHTKEPISPHEVDIGHESTRSAYLPSPSSSGNVQTEREYYPRSNAVGETQLPKVLPPRTSLRQADSDLSGSDEQMQTIHDVGAVNDEFPRNSEEESYYTPYDSSSPESTLRHELYEARIEWPEGSHRYFIPANDLQRLVTPESILTELPTCTGTDEEKRETAENISKSAPKLFAILVGLKQEHRIFGFINEGIDDRHLPFIRSDKNAKARYVKLCSVKHPGQHIECMATWDRELVDAFGRDQWCMLAPIFEYHDEIEHYELHDNCLLPWIKDEERSDKAIEGGYGSVWKIAIHEAHQRVRSDSNHLSTSKYVALKQLHSTNEQRFRSEVDMFKKLKSRKHAHLVNLLATFRLKGRFYLIFPYAHCNLRQYWEHTPIPDFTSATTFWMLQECKAVASALHLVHESRFTQEPLVFQPSGSGSDAVHSEDDVRLYGRHGDIKAENILWFPEEKHGLLVIADFGLMAFHSKETRSDINAKHVTGSPSYEPPELTLHSRISRAFDIWSLGCLYLEFVTWLVCGWQQLQRFPEARKLMEASNPEIHDDTFFTIIESEHKAIVREAVQDWIQDLHEMPRASSFVHEFVDLISGQLLVVDPVNRIKMGELNKRLSNMLQRAQQDSLYLTDPKPYHPQALQARLSSQTAFRLNGVIQSPQPEEGRPLPSNLEGFVNSYEPSAATPPIQPLVLQTTSPPSTPTLI